MEQEDQVAPVAAEQASTPGGAAEEANDTLAGVLAAYVEQLRLLDGVIPELIGGSTLAEVRESAVRAKAAYERVAAQVAAGAPAPVKAENPAGGKIAAGAGGGTRGNASIPTPEGFQKRPSGYALILKGLAQGNGGSAR
ncbi:MAG TPA: hypothetical protein VH186_01155 [Chloroflexia bacterium]|nr:hypothetical protein [Chloroflexia bacterium]